MAELPKLYIDNPGGDWLQSKLKQAQKDYQTAPSDTSTRKVGAANITGYFREDLDLSPDLLKDIPGALGEEDYRESGEKLNLIEESIQEEGYKPSPILVFVREDGQPFIIEGNHRVVEAVKSGRDTIPVELRYLRGAEDVEGPLSVERLRQFYESRPTRGHWVGSKGEPTQLSPEALKAFKTVSSTQRGAPETAMLDVLGSRVAVELDNVLEHIGDLTHVLTNEAEWGSFRRERVRSKIAGKVQTLENPNLEAFIEQNHEGLAHYNRETKGVSESVDTIRERYHQLMKKYADEHRKIPVFNRPQKLARDAAVAVGERQFKKAAELLRALDKIAEDPTGFQHAASIFQEPRPTETADEPRPLVRKVYHGTREEGLPEKTGFGGFHFGTAQAAENRLREGTYSRMKGGKPGGEKIIPFEITLNNPYGTEENPISEHDLFMLLNMPGAFEEFKKKGFDGIIYENSVEDPGSISYLVLDKENIQQLPEPPLELFPRRRPHHLPALLGAASAASQLREPGEEPRPTGKGPMWRGIGGLKQISRRMFPIITAVQQAWPYIPDEYKQNIGDAVDWLKETKTHELFGLDKSGLEYFKELMTPTPEEGIGTLPEAAEAIPLPDLSPPPEEGIGTLPEAAQRLVNAPSSVADEARQARREYDEIMGITKDFKPTFKEVPGEWFLVEGEAQFADGDVGDFNHDMIVREHVVRKLVDVIDANFDVDWEYWADKAESIGGGDDMTESPEGREILTRNVHKFLENKIKDASEGKDALLDKLGINEEELLIASGDPRSYPREYGIRHLGYVRVAGNNVEAYDITSKKLREIANGLWDAAGDESVEGMTFDVEDAKTNTLYSDVPFSVLDSGNMRALREFKYDPGKASGGIVTLPEFAEGGWVGDPMDPLVGLEAKLPVVDLFRYPPEIREQLDREREASDALMDQGRIRDAMKVYTEGITHELLGMNMLGAGVTVFHGGPTRWLAEKGFPKGRPSKAFIGTGEGHGAFGHGFYAAEIPDVARMYKNRLSDIERYGIMEAGKEVPFKEAWKRAYGEELPAKVVQWFNFPRNPQSHMAALENMAYRLDLKVGRVDKGALYKLDVPDADAARMLDWDMPLSEQPGLMKALEKRPSTDSQRLSSFLRTEAETRGLKYEDLTGKQVQTFLEGVKPKIEVATDLEAIGIPGLKYFDQFSRPGQKGSRNYVVWDQEVLDRTKVLESYVDEMIQIPGYAQGGSVEKPVFQGIGHFMKNPVQSLVMGA